MGDNNGKRANNNTPSYWIKGKITTGGVKKRD